MSAFAAFVAGWLAGVLTIAGIAILALRWSGDRTDDLRDEHAEPLFVGGGADFLNHGAEQ
jgi:hypothetical protein